MWIEVRDVRKRYGAVEALGGLNAEISGQVIGLLGPNGAGKSTLMKLLLGLLTFEGHARVLGLDPRTQALQIRDQIGYMPESDSHLPRMSAVEMCAYAGELAGLPPAEAMGRAHLALHTAELGDKRYLPVHEYSTGLKQRVKLAQALVHDPKLLFLDEPTNGLDPAGREDMLRLIADLPKRRGLAIVLSTHLLPDVERVCDRVVVLSHGKLLFSGTVDELRGDARSGELDVRMKEPVPAFKSSLESAGCVVHVDPMSPERFRVVLPTGATPGLLFAIARAQGAQIRHLAQGRASLEDGFLRRLHG